MQEIIVNQCECPFEVSAIVDLNDLVPGTRYNYTVSLMNTGNAVFHPNSGEFLADSVSDTLNLTMYLRDNPNNHYLISFELFDPYYDIVRRQIICVKNTSCPTLQCTPTPTPTPTRRPHILNKYLDLSNYKISSDKKSGAFKSTITVGDWVEFLNAVASYDDINNLWKPEMEADLKCGIQRKYDGFFYVYTINGCDVDEFGCYDNDNDLVSRTVGYVSWSDLARYINWIHNGKPKGRQGPETTEEGSYPLYGNRYASPGIPHHKGARFWLDTTTVIQACPVTATPTNTPTPSVTIGLTPTATPTTTATRTPTASVTPPPPSATPTTTLTATPTTTTTLTSTPTPTSTNLPVGISITSQPPVDIFSLVGINETISVTAVAVPNTISLTYQWQSSDDGGSTWNNIGGAVSSSYTINNPQLINLGRKYRVIVSGIPASGSGVNTPSPVISNVATLTVDISSINIINQPANSTITGTSTSFSVSATISPSRASLSYQWQRSIDAGISYTNISGATSSILNLSNLTTTESGYRYRVIVSGTGGANTVTSDEAVLTVNAPEITITSQPTNTTSVNAEASFSVIATIVGATAYTLSYQWQKSTDGGLTFSNISGATSNTYTLTSLTSALNNYVYRVVVSSNVGSSPVTSTSAVLTIDDDYGGLFVWGANGNNQLNFSGTPTSPSFTNKRSTIYREVSLGQNHSLFINSSGILETYGINTLSQAAGNGTNNVLKVATKYNHNLMIVSLAGARRLYSWGANSFGQCGQSSSTTVTTPTLIPSDTNEYIDIATGENHSLALRSNNILVACGKNDLGQLGLNNTNNYSTFVTVTGNISSVACGANHSAAIDKNGILYTWGNNGNGQLGLGDTTNRSIPTAVSGTNWTKVVCGQNFTAALNSSNELYAWGSNIKGQLGNNSIIDSTVLVKISGSWQSISAGNLHMLGIATDGTLYAWGNGGQYQIGSGGTTDYSVPTAIGIQPDTNWLDVFAGPTSSAATRKGSVISINTQPSGVESNNSSASFNIAAGITSGSSLTYQWQRSIDSGASWSNISAQTSTSLNLTNTNNSNDGYQYRCLLSGSENAYPVNSNSATLTEKSSTIWVRGSNTNNVFGFVPFNTTNYSTTWTQVPSWNHGSTSVAANSANTNLSKTSGVTVKQISRCSSNAVAYLLSDGNVIVTGGGTNRTIANPAGETIIEIQSNYSTYTASTNVVLAAKSASGKLYFHASTVSGATVSLGGVTYGNGWTRVGASLLVSKFIIGTWDSANQPPYIYAISSIDSTLWAFGNSYMVSGGALNAFTTTPAQIGVDTWTDIGGMWFTAIGIKTDGFLYRIHGYWGGGAVYNTNTSVVFNTGNTTGSPNPTLIDNSIAYTKVSACRSVIGAYDINNKLHMTPYIHIPRDLPVGVTDVTNLKAEDNNYLYCMVNNEPINASNIFMMNAPSIINVSYSDYNNTTVYNANTSTSSLWGTNSLAPVGVRPKFKDYIPNTPIIFLKDD